MCFSRPILSSNRECCTSSHKYRTRTFHVGLTCFGSSSSQFHLELMHLIKLEELILSIRGWPTNYNKKQRTIILL